MISRKLKVSVGAHFLVHHPNKKRYSVNLIRIRLSKNIIENVSKNRISLPLPRLYKCAKPHGVRSKSVISLYSPCIDVIFLSVVRIVVAVVVGRNERRIGMSEFVGRYDGRQSSPSSSLAFSDHFYRLVDTVC